MIIGPLEGLLVLDEGRQGRGPIDIKAPRHRARIGLDIGAIGRHQVLHLARQAPTGGGILPLHHRIGRCHRPGQRFLVIATAAYHLRVSDVIAEVLSLIHISEPTRPY